MNRRIVFAALVTAGVTTILLAQLVVPVSRRWAHLGGGATHPTTDSALTLRANAELPDAVAALLDRACRDCHTNETRWPWYSRVAPVSWLVINDVNHGREHVNYSAWMSYTDEEQTRLLRNTCNLTRDGSMPPPAYRRLHRATVLADAEIDRLCSWTDSTAVRRVARLRTRNVQTP